MRNETIQKEMTPNDYWNEQQKLYASIQRAGSFQEYFEQLQNYQKFFELKDRIIRCVDERVGGGICSAGSCILMRTRKDIQDFIYESRATGITSHSGCGAAKLALINTGNSNPTKIEVDEYAIKFAKDQASKFGLVYEGHLEVEPNFHPGIAVYFDGTGKFDPTTNHQIPMGFVISRKYLKPEYALAELDVVLNKIILNGNDYSKNITPQNPVYVVPIGDAYTITYSLAEMQKEIEEALKNHPQKELIKIDGLSIKY